MGKALAVSGQGLFLSQTEGGRGNPPFQGDGAMTKSDLIANLLQKHPELIRKDAESLVRIIFDQMRDSLARGERIEIRGFGSFHVKQRAPRAGRNPKTGSQVAVEEKKIPCFKVGKDLREKVNFSDSL